MIPAIRPDAPRVLAVIADPRTLPAAEVGLRGIQDRTAAETAEADEADSLPVPSVGRPRERDALLNSEVAVLRPQPVAQVNVRARH